MLIGVTKMCSSPLRFHHFVLQFPLVRSISSLEQTLKAKVEAKAYQEIPDLFESYRGEYFENPNPFSFLSTFSLNLRTQVVDEILQSFIPLRPHFRPQLVYSCLLSYTLQSPSPLPLALAILQRTFRSGCSPVPQTRLLLSSAWLDRRRQSHTVANILEEMESIGYRPDSGICNYLVSSLCAVDQLPEAVKVLKGMGRAGCVPDLEGYGFVIGSMCTARRTADAVEMLKEMVVKSGLNPRHGTVVKIAAALRANREIWTAVEMIEFMEREGCHVGFESYELVLEGCLECKEYLLAGKVAMRMTEKRFIPYIKVRQKVVEKLAGVGEWKLACAVRQRFTELSS